MIRGSGEQDRTNTTTTDNTTLTSTPTIIATFSTISENNSQIFSIGQPYIESSKKEGKYFGCKPGFYNRIEPATKKSMRSSKKDTAKIEALRKESIMEAKRKDSDSKNPRKGSNTEEKIIRKETAIDKYTRKDNFDRKDSWDDKNQRRSTVEEMTSHRKDVMDRRKSSEGKVVKEVEESKEVKKSKDVKDGKDKLPKEIQKEKVLVATSLKEQIVMPVTMPKHDKLPFGNRIPRPSEDSTGATSSARSQKTITAVREVEETKKIEKVKVKNERDHSVSKVLPRSLRRNTADEKKLSSETRELTVHSTRNSPTRLNKKEDDVYVKGRRSSKEDPAVKRKEITSKLDQKGMKFAKRDLVDIPKEEEVPKPAPPPEVDDDSKELGFLQKLQRNVKAYFSPRITETTNNESAVSGDKN